MRELSIIVFAYNEAENIEPVLGELRQWLSAHELDSEIIFVDDGSTDTTREAADRALLGFPYTLYRHDKKQGIGAALKSGVRIAQGRWVTFLPADGQIPPSAIGTLRAAATEHKSDIVLSIYNRRNDGWHRKILSWGVRTLITMLHGVRLKSEGPYLFERTLFDPNSLPSDSFFLNFEFPIRVLQTGRKVAVVTIPCRRRLSGHSKSASTQQAFHVARDLVLMRCRSRQHKPR
ncbi:MAG: glycosyltransferase family 2 protein [Myxococcales bacterium]|nr:glycosyltransferase family 2 protein [Myxococcales bacterium]MCB9709199.1 glycosyltransferase family 2 protein [Myxococcales bacterium]